jgi:fermentation-respiration switch protein FrsA (DUF1100 family)
LCRLTVIVLLTYVGVCVVVTFLQARLIYFPSAHYHATPADLGLSFEDLALKTSDDVSIAAWYVPHPHANHSVIFCHGNAGNMSDRLHSIKLLHDMGLAVLIFDYRGYGRSSGRPSEQGTYDDAEAAWRYLVETRGQSPDSLVLFGRSLGGAVAIDLASRHRPAALVVESTFTSLVDVGRLHYPLLPVRLLMSYRYESISKVHVIDCPKLFIHGLDDEIVPLSNGRRLFEAASEPKRFIETPGDHNNSGFTHSRRYADKLQVYLQDVLQSCGK